MYVSVCFSFSKFARIVISSVYFLRSQKQLKEGEQRSAKSILEAREYK